MVSYSESSGRVWYSWVEGTTASSTTNGTTWNQWMSADFSSSSDSTTSTVWATWNSSSGIVIARSEYRYSPPPETEEQRQARLQREEQARIAAEERKHKEAEALQRAEDLLMLQLNARQLDDWRKNKAFDVVSQSGRRFRIRNSRSMNVDEYDDAGKKVASHCIVPTQSVPAYDQFVMQKLMLENHEADFMRIANHSRAN